MNELDAEEETIKEFDTNDLQQNNSNNDLQEKEIKTETSQDKLEN